jgi:hypothetical protein
MLWSLPRPCMRVVPRRSLHSSRALLHGEFEKEAPKSPEEVVQIKVNFLIVSLV